MSDFKLKSLAILNEDTYPTTLDAAQFVTYLFYGDCNNWTQFIYFNFSLLYSNIVGHGK